MESAYDESYEHRSRLIAGILSLLAPGLGHIYNRQINKGFLLLGLIVTLVILLRSPIVLWGGAYTYLGLIGLYSAVWIYSVLNAIIDVSTPRPKTDFNKLYTYISTPVFLFAFITATKWVLPAENYYIPSNSMAPTLVNGDYIIVDKSAYNSNKPKAGDIALFRYPKDESVHFVQRIIGVPGDKIAINKGVLYINDKKVESQSHDKPELIAYAEADQINQTVLLQENLAGAEYFVFRGTNHKYRTNYHSQVIPDGMYFVLGDNRDASSDSRIWGNVPEENILGKAHYIYFSVSPRNQRIGWNRIGVYLH